MEQKKRINKSDVVVKEIYPEESEDYLIIIKKLKKLWEAEKQMKQDVQDARVRYYLHAYKIIKKE